MVVRKKFSRWISKFVGTLVLLGMVGLAIYLPKILNNFELPPAPVFTTPSETEIFIPYMETPMLPKTYHVYIVGPATDTERQIVRNSIIYWNKFADKLLFSETSGDGDIVIQFKWMETCGETRNGFEVIGCAIPSESGFCPIEIKPTRASVQVLTHEMGHCLGFDHSPNPESLMFFMVIPYVSQSFTTAMLEKIDSFYPLTR